MYCAKLCCSVPAKAVKKTVSWWTWSENNVELQYSVGNYEDVNALDMSNKNLRIHDTERKYN